MARAYVEVARRRARYAAAGEVVDVDGIAMLFSNLADDAQNGGFVVSEPADAANAIAAAEIESTRRGHGFGLEVERGRFPAVEVALADAGLSRLLSRPAMAIDPATIRVPDAMPELLVGTVDDERGLSAVVSIEVEAFGTEPDVAAGLLRSILADPETRVLLGSVGGAFAAEAIASRHDGTVGIFGVGVRARNRRRGIGAAMTASAVRAFPDVDLAWLLPTPKAGTLYERLGFETASTWDVWVRASR
jgi:GNAT superfamily N-acetyltransferase